MNKACVNVSHSKTSRYSFNEIIAQTYVFAPTLYMEIIHAYYSVDARFCFINVYMYVLNAY